MNLHIQYLCVYIYAVLQIDTNVYYILYLSLGRSYEAGTCTIAISVKRAFKRYPFCYRLDFDPKS